MACHVLGAYGKWRSYARGRRRAQRKRLEQKRRDQRALRPRSGANATSSPQSQTVAAEVAADVFLLVVDQPISAEHKNKVDVLKQQVAAAEAKLAAALAAQDANRQDLEQSLDRELCRADDWWLHAARSAGLKVRLSASRRRRTRRRSRRRRPRARAGRAAARRSLDACAEAVAHSKGGTALCQLTPPVPPEPEALTRGRRRSVSWRPFGQELRTQMAHQAECIQRLRRLGSPAVSRAQQISPAGGARTLREADLRRRSR